MFVSIITTLYKSEKYINEFYKRSNVAARKITDNYEIIFVDDGSPDKSLSLALELHKLDSKVKVIELSKNFGHHQAILAGLSYVKGELVFLIDIDLEEQPELLNEFFDALNYNKSDVVYGIQENRKGKGFERLSGELFYALFNRLSSQKIARNFVTARLMTGDYVKALLTFPERELFLGGLFNLTGFKQIGLPVVKNSRGSSSYSFSKRLKLFINAITSFSDKPLVIMFGLGLFFTIVALLYAAFLFFQRIFIGTVPSGWTSLAFLILFMGALNLLSLGVISIYLSKIFIEVKNRPRAVIRKIYE